MALPKHMFVMEDGTMLPTEIFYDQPNECSSITDRRLNLWLQHMYEKGDMVVGFDTEWTYKKLYSFHLYNEIGVKVALLKLCTQAGCALINLRADDLIESRCPCLIRFLFNKDIVIAGVHIKEDINMLQTRFRTHIRNAVDLSDLAATVLHQPRLTAYGVRGLASEVLLEPWKPRPFKMVTANWCATPLSDEQIQCATVDAYAAYKIAKKLIC